jgi:hypothetical protein
MRGAAMLLHAVFFMIAAHILLLLAHSTSVPLLAQLLDLASFGWFVPLGLSGAAALHGKRSIAIVILAGTIIIGWPYPTMEKFSRAVTPIGVGVLVGSIVRASVRDLAEGLHDDSTESLRPPE